MKSVILYTDGACSGNPGPGGWAAILRYGSAEKELSGGEKQNQCLHGQKPYLGFVGLRTPGITSAPGMKRKSFARRSDSPIRTVPSAAVAIASNW